MHKYCQSILINGLHITKMSSFPYLLSMYRANEAILLSSRTSS
uniref:Uncharacterized protein n=1 Tax=Arundo donax TaxID=35708 RepID=A0A0A9EQV3_ARUDO